ncbi:hypothetical protein QVZ41_13825 [Wenyingzhuangia sp. chi5]|uniref:Uncharacterized protein n=1 Tax=Wenyingzhuangia gilva TaxID=3057677 RepID=A0ABT8VVD3_9FLAO|nr:hypothetical protein [Wenyingzhuangia sp. chi5]MDO3695925.1 hypothetical protein [Wenyingzhuangia sp. chi5]
MKNNHRNLKKEILIFTISLFVIVSFIVVLYKTYQYKDYESWNNKKIVEVDALVVDKEIGGGKGLLHSVIKYTINDTIYKTNISGYHTIGERLMIECEYNNYKNIRIRKLPFFLDSEDCSYVLGKITKVEKGEIYFTYWNNNKPIEYKHSIFGEFSKKLLPINKKKLYVVQFLKKNPKRSLIHLDKSVNYTNYWWKYNVNNNGEIYKLENEKH